MTNSPAQVLIVDDAVVVRHILCDIVAATPNLAVAGTAANGLLALQKLEQTAVDLVLLDVEMPELDGIETARRIRVRWPRLPIVMCSTLTARGGEATLRALAAGATDYITKPSSLGGSAGMEKFSGELRQKLDTLTARRRIVAAPATLPVVARPRRTPPGRPAVLAIGCSTGGPNALARVFADLPRDLAVPVLITQHMPPLFTRLLADRLTAEFHIPVKEAAEGDVLEPGKGYVAPGDYHMQVRREGTRVRICLDQGPPENSCRPAVDVMLRSVAQVFGADVIAAILTGMGRDGAVGARHVVNAGGWMITQDTASCVVASMPNAVAAAGMSDEIVELDRLGAQLGFRCRNTEQPLRSSPSSPPPAKENNVRPHRR